ncbi:MAG: ubiquinone/menaquinone biosynthesis methyltransferase [Candidatus Dormibacteraceae bacterium]
MPERDAAQVERMFDRIAQRYDLLNTVLSAGSDARWRRRTAIATAVHPTDRVLDVACGSGRLARALGRQAPAGGVVGLDFSAGMLQVAQRASPGPHYARGDGLALPFADRTFDGATNAFGLRNLADPLQGLAEMRRVVRPGGRLGILEFVRPSSSPVGRAYRVYLRRGLPLIGGWISGQPQAYRYLSDTVDTYRTPGELLELAAESGWNQVALQLLTLGTVGLLTGRRAEEDDRTRRFSR